MTDQCPPCPVCGADAKTVNFDWEKGHWVEHHCTTRDCWITYDQFRFLGRWFSEQGRDVRRETWPDSYELTSERQLRERIRELTQAQTQ